MSEIKIPAAIRHSHQRQQMDLGETILISEGETPDRGGILGTIWNAEDFGFPAKTEKIDAMARAFADKLVRAYNCHDLLIAALQELGDWLAYGLEKPDGAIPTEDDERRCREVASKARYALAKAKGEPDEIS